MVLRAVAKARQTETETAQSLAYYGAFWTGVFSRIEKLSGRDYQKYAPKQGKRKSSGKRQTPKQMLAMVEAFNTMVGGEDRRKER